jgi:hemolysin activation/secretion protein
VLRHVRYTGASVIDEAELQALAQPLLNRPLRWTDLEELRQRVTRLYIARGYVSSGAGWTTAGWPKACCRCG